MQQLEIDNGVRITSTCIKNTEWTHYRGLPWKTVESESRQIDLLHSFRHTSGDLRQQLGKRTYAGGSRDTGFLFADNWREIVLERAVNCVRDGQGDCPAGGALCNTSEK